MDNPAADNTGAQSPAEKRSRFSRLHLFIFLAMTAVVLVLAWSSMSARSLMLTFVPQVNAAMQSRISLTEAHLWLEEIVSGDASEDPQQVWDKIGEARWHVRAMLDGGERDGRVYLPVADEGLHADLLMAVGALDRFEKMGRQRVDLAARAAAAATEPALSAAESTPAAAPAKAEDPEDPGAGTPAGSVAPPPAKPIESASVGSQLDQQFDDAFQEYFALAEKIEGRLLALSARALDVFVTTQVVLMLVVVALFGWIIWLLLRKEALQRDQYVNSMQESLDRLARNQRELEQQNAQRGALVELAAGLQGMEDPERIADTALRQLCAKTGAKVGVFWASQGRGLRRLATQALPAERAGMLTLEEGEGLAGRAARDQQIVSVDIPSDYLPLTSGLGQAPAPHLRVLPLVHDGQTVGVLELVFIEPPGDFVQGLLAAAAPAIAVRMHMAGGHGRH